MENKIDFFVLAGWLFGLVVFTVGVLNLFLVHPVPGIAYLLVSCLYFPPANSLLRQKFNFSLPLFVKIILALVLILFTLGVSDLGDMID